MSLSSNRPNVLLASEATYGVDAVNLLLTTATALIVHAQVRSCEIKTAREIAEVERQSASAAGHPHVSFADRADVTIEFPLTGKAAGGAGNEAPYYSPILKASNLAETIVSGTSATYDQRTVNQPAMTVYKYERSLTDDTWRLLIARGVRGNLVLNFEVNAEAYASFTGVGLYEAPISDGAEFFSAGAVALLKDGATAVTARTGSGDEIEDKKTAMGCKGITASFAATTIPISNLQLDLAWTPDPIRTMQGAASVKEVLNTRGGSTRTNGSFELEDSGTSMETIRDAWENDTEGQIVLTLTDGTDTITITLPKVQIMDLAPGATGNVRKWTVPFSCNANWDTLGGDNDLGLAYT